MFTREFTLKSPNGYDIHCISTDMKAYWPAVVCLHGMGGSKQSQVIAALCEKLQGHGVDLIAFDWAGHGESAADGSQLSVEGCQADLDTVVNYARERGAYDLRCFATSMGGYMATLYRNAHPDVFSRMVLRSPALRFGEVLRQIPGKNDLKAMERGGTFNYGFARPLELGQSFLDEVDAHDAFHAPVCEPERVHIIQGDADTIVRPEDTKDYAARNRIGIDIIAGADHLYGRSSDRKKIMNIAVPFLLEG